MYNVDNERQHRLSKSRSTECNLWRERVKTFRECGFDPYVGENWTSKEKEHRHFKLISAHKFILIRMKKTYAFDTHN